MKKAGSKNRDQAEVLIIEYAFITCKGPLIGIEHLSRELLEEAKQEGPRHLSPQKLKEAEKIQAALERHSGNRPDAARPLEQAGPPSGGR